MMTGHAYAAVPDVSSEQNSAILINVKLLIATCSYLLIRNLQRLEMSRKPRLRVGALKMRRFLLDCGRSCIKEYI